MSLAFCGRSIDKSLWRASGNTAKTELDRSVSATGEVFMGLPFLGTGVPAATIGAGQSPVNCARGPIVSLCCQWDNKRDYGSAGACPASAVRSRTYGRCRRDGTHRKGQHRRAAGAAAPAPQGLGPALL